MGQRAAGAIPTTVAAVVLALLAPAPRSEAAVATCLGARVTMHAEAGGGAIFGTPGDDVILGTPGADRIFGRGGDDTICGLGGRDLLVGGPGDDVIDGGSGRDVLRGGGGDDLLTGGSGADTLAGGVGADRISGRAGPDVLRGGGGRDVLRAGSGTDVCSGEVQRSCEMTDVSPGDRGPSVAYLQQRLADALLYRGPIDGVYPDDPRTRPGDMTAAVYAFHKLHGDPAGDAWTSSDHVSREWTLADWRLLEAFDPAAPVARPGEADRFEVDARHEVMWLILDGEVAGIFHVSVGGEFTYLWMSNLEVAHTPRGDLDVDHYWDGRRVDGWMYRAWYYLYTHRWMALHGYYTVPPYPASHGCVRVTYGDADWIHARVGGNGSVGTPFHIWDG